MVSKRYQFGDYVVDPERNLVTSDQGEVQLEPKSMDVLVMLLERPGRVVSVDELLDTVWAGQVVEGATIYQRVSKLRQALGEDPRAPRYIENVPRRGYRTVAPVTKVDTPQRSRAPSWIVVLFALTLPLAGAAWWFLDNGSASSGAAIEPIRTIAVMPLKNLSGDPGQEYIADGMTEEVIGALAQFESLRVISRTSVMRFKTTSLPVASIAEDLGADAIIEGTVTREADRYRVTLQLIDAHTDTPRWSETFDRSSMGVLALRSDIAQEVADQISLELSPSEVVELTDTAIIDPRAYEAFLRGRAAIGTLPMAHEWAAEALSHFERAVQFDPTFAAAWAQVGVSRMLMGRFESSRLAIDRAIELGDRSGQAQFGRAVFSMFRWDFDTERAAATQAFELAPNSPESLGSYATVLMRQGLFDDAMRVFERLLLVAPFDPIHLGFYHKGLFLTRQYSESLIEGARIREALTNYQDDFEAAAFLKLGMATESYESTMAYLGRCGPPCRALLEATRSGWEQGGLEGSIRARLAVAIAERTYENAMLVPGGSPLMMAIDYVVIGEHEEALDWLERGRDIHGSLMYVLSVFPQFDALRTHARFERLLESMAFPDNRNAEMRADVALWFALRGQGQKAIAEIEAALPLLRDDPRVPRWHYYLSFAYFVERDYTQSLVWADRAVQAGEEAGRTTALAHLLSAAAHVEAANPDAAKAAVQAARSLWPDMRIEQDLAPLLLGSEASVRERYLDGLRKAGLPD